MPTLDRRAFLHKGGRAALGIGAAILAGSLAGCTESPPTRRPPPRPTRPTATTSPPTPADARSWSALAEQLSGRLVRPGDASYDSARLVYDLRYAGAHPAAVARCASVEDVVACVRFARDHGIAPIPRSGGHSFGGYSTGGGLVIDTGGLAGVRVEAGGSRLRVGAGTLLVDLYAACAEAGVLVPGGSCPTVGIAGLALGGGTGVLARAYGLTCDNLLGVELVTADGVHLACDAEHHPDLFWACRGGGGRNFGVATAFTFATRPIPVLSHFTLTWPWASAPSALEAWLEWAHAAPEELWANCQLVSQGTDGLALRASGVYVGGEEALLALLDPLRAAAGPASSVFVGSDGYLQTMLLEAGCDGLEVAQCHLAGVDAGGTLSRAMFAGKSAYLSDALPAPGRAAMLGAIEAAHASDPETGAAIVLDAYGGAINRVAPGATAFVHRDARCGIEMSMSFSPDASIAEVAERSAAWLGATASALAPYGNGQAYQNYIDPTLEGWLAAYYGANARRLSAVKRAYDPGGLFRFAQSIPA